MHQSRSKTKIYLIFFYHKIEKTTKLNRRRKLKFSEMEDKNKNQLNSNHENNIAND